MLSLIRVSGLGDKVSVRDHLAGPLFTMAFMNRFAESLHKPCRACRGSHINCKSMSLLVHVRVEIKIKGHFHLEYRLLMSQRFYGPHATASEKPIRSPSVKCASRLGQPFQRQRDPGNLPECFTPVRTFQASDSSVYE